MPLTSDWKLRIEQYIDALSRRIKRQVIQLKLEMATTFDYLTPQEAKKLSYVPSPKGTKWGEKWEYAWFRSKVVVNSDLKGSRLELFFKSNESLIWVNGRLAGATDRQHDMILLTKNAIEGETFDILIESYAGHGTTPSHYGILNPGEESVPEPGKTQQTVSGASVVSWNEEGYQLLMDLYTLFDASEAIDENSLRRNKIEKALMDVSCIIELETDDETFNDSVKKAREFLVPVMKAQNGSTAPEMFCIGHAHIDIAWKWPLDVTKRKAGRTFSTAIRMMEQYPEYKFLQSQPQLYAYTKEHYPELYEEIKDAVKRGQWIPDGSLWVECDTNLISGESMIRQIMYGKKFFREEFGVDNEVIWLPDVFGYSGAMPQIMRGCGAKYFSTHKLYWNYHGGTNFPYDTFIWEGIDGSTVLAHNHRNYNNQTKPHRLIERWNKCNQKAETEIMLYPYGWGDGGGGPTRDHLEFLRRLKDFEGVPRTRQVTLKDFFKEVEKRGIPEARYVGELYFEAHRGVYTTQAKTKKGNRKSEFALREAEMWNAAAFALKNLVYPANDLETAWKQVLLNQFHDIIPGSSITRVYEEANKGYDHVIEKAGELTDIALNSLLTASDMDYTVWNSLSWDRDSWVTIPITDKSLNVMDMDGNVLPSQIIESDNEKRILAKVPNIPSCGAATIRVASGNYDVSGDSTCQVKLDDNVIENEFLRVEIGRKGEIISLWDKQAQRELVTQNQTINKIEMYQDQPARNDAWDIDIAYKRNPVSISDYATLTPVYTGSLEAKLHIERVINQSVMKQDIILRSGERRVDFVTEINWRETHKLLKVAFPVKVHSDSARYEIQFGHVSRARHQNTEFDRSRFEVSGHKWMDISENGYGFTILNDCKYGWDVLDGIPRLTLLKAPIAPDAYADQGVHQFTYSIYIHNEQFGSNVVREGYDLNVPVKLTKGLIGNEPAFSLMSVDKPNIIIETLKCSEDGKALIVRMYEAVNSQTVCRLKIGLPVKSAAICNMLEEDESSLELANHDLLLDFRPFEIKTIKLNIK